MALFPLSFATLNSSVQVSLVSVPVSGFQQTTEAAGARVIVTGAISGTGIFEESFDGGLTWFASAYVIDDAQPTGYSDSVTAAGTYTLSLIGSTNLRLRIATSGSGTANVSFVLLPTAPSLITPALSMGESATIGAVTVTSGSIAVTSSPAVTLASGQVVALNGFGGGGVSQAVPAGTGVGTPLGTLPTGALGFKFYLNQGDTVTGIYAAAQPGSAPSSALLQTYIGPNGPNPMPEYLSGTTMFYVTNIDGSPTFRWI